MKAFVTRRIANLLLASKRMTASPTDATVDLVTLGQRLRHQRRAKGMTLASDR